MQYLYKVEHNVIFSDTFFSYVQYFAGGAGAEGEIARYLEKVKSITKLGYNFTVPSFRTKVDGFIMRNLDYGECKGNM